MRLLVVVGLAVALAGCVSAEEEARQAEAARRAREAEVRANQRAIIERDAREAREQEAREQDTRGRPAPRQDAERSRVAEAPPPAPELTLAVAQLGDVVVRVRRARVGKVRVKGAYSGVVIDAPEDLVALTVDIENTSTTRKIDYRTWGDREALRLIVGELGVLRDNFGNEYRRAAWSDGRVVETLLWESIYPETTLREVLAFEPPIARVQLLELELPGKNLGLEGKLLLQIPAEAIER